MDNAAACMTAPFCFTFKTGGSQNAHVIEVFYEGCAGYQSSVNLDAKMVGVKKWLVRLCPGWKLNELCHRSPVDKTQVDCKDLFPSKCLADLVSFGQRGCFCDAGFKWDPINGL